MKEPDRIEILKDGIHYYLDAKEVTEKAYRKRHPVPDGGGIFMTSSSKAWPMWSDAAGCHPKDAQKFMENARNLGVPTVFSKKDGRCQFESRDHQRRYLQAIGWHNNDDNWSGKGSREPPPPPKKRPKIGRVKLEMSDAEPEMRTATDTGVRKRRRKSR